jgi:hypothetical protein
VQAEIPNRRSVMPVKSRGGKRLRSKLEERVVKAAEVALADRHFVTAIDVLVGMGWLTTPQVDRWRQGRVDYLERLVTANISKISTGYDRVSSLGPERGAEAQRDRLPGALRGSSAVAVLKER